MTIDIKLNRELRMQLERYEPALEEARNAAIYLKALQASRMYDELAEKAEAELEEAGQVSRDASWAEAEAEVVDEAPSRTYD